MGTNSQISETWTNGMTLITADPNLNASNAKFLPQTCLLNVIQVDSNGTPTIQLEDTNQTIGLLIQTDDIDQLHSSQNSQVLQVENLQIEVDEDEINVQETIHSENNSMAEQVNALVEETLKPKNNKPLGSSENPIKFIQHGETFHSTQNISQEQLRKIAEALQLQSGRAKEIKESTILVEPANNSNSSSKIVYRVVYPEDLDLQPLKQTIKRGRPKKKDGVQPAQAAANEEEEEEFLQPLITKTNRTRSGRITKPPRHHQKAFKQVEVAEPKLIEPPTPVVQEPPPVEQNKLIEQQRKRPIAAQFRCPVCKKAYLGRSRMLKHFEMNPDHGPIPDNLKPKDDELWIQAIERAQKAPDNQKAMQFCQELSRLIQNARMLVPFLFKPARAGDENCYEVDDSLASALGLHPGNYSLADSALVKDISMLNLPDAISSSLHTSLIGHTNSILNSHHIVDELILPVVDTGQESMNLDTSTNSDDVMNVDQLVNERLKNLTDAELEPNINHSLNLDLGLDLFSFNPS